MLLRKVYRRRHGGDSGYTRTAMMPHGDSPFPQDDDEPQSAPTAAARWLAVASAALVAAIAVSRAVTCACECAHRTSVATAAVAPADPTLRNA